MNHEANRNRIRYHEDPTKEGWPNQNSIREHRSRARKASGHSPSKRPPIIEEELVELLEDCANAAFVDAGADLPSENDEAPHNRDTPSVSQP